MKTVILNTVLAMFIGGFCVFAIMKYIEPQPKSISNVSESAATTKLLYTANEVEERIKYEKDRLELRENWRSIIRVSKQGGEQLGLTGGFRNVQIIVNNDSNYKLDEVTVLIELEGFWNSKMCHSAVLTFDDIGAIDEVSDFFTYTDCGQILHCKVIGFKCNALKVKVKPEN